MHHTSKLPRRQLVEAGALVLSTRPDCDNDSDDSFHASGSCDIEIALQASSWLKNEKIPYKYIVYMKKNNSKITLCTMYTTNSKIQFY